MARATRAASGLISTDYDVLLAEYMSLSDLVAQTPLGTFNFTGTLNKNGVAVATTGDVSTHAALTTGVHGVGAGTVAKVTDITDANLVCTDVATNNSSTTKHGFLKKLDNDATHFMNGQGTWLVPAGASGAPGGYSYRIVINGADAEAYNSTGTLVYGGATDEGATDGAQHEDVINAAITALAGTGGLVLLQAGTYNITTAILHNQNDVWLVGEGWGTILNVDGNVDAITIGADGSTMYRIGLLNLRIDCAAGTSGVCGVRQWRTTASVFQNIYITGSSANDRLQYGWFIEQEADGDHSWDNFYSNTRILNFYTDGFHIEDIEDSQFTNINVGTQNAGANACWHWETPNAGTDSGGSGLMISNFHFWGVAGNTVYGIYISGAQNGCFGSRWSNVWGGDVQNGLYFESADAHDHDMSNVKIGTCSVARLTDSGTRNYVANYKPGTSTQTGSWMTGVGFTEYTS